MQGFEATFAIPAEHRLELVRSRARGGLVRAEYWRHEEFDTDGALVAVYESFSEADPASGTVNSGWRRYDPQGVLTATHEGPAEGTGKVFTAAA